MRAKEGVLPGTGEKDSEYRGAGRDGRDTARVLGILTVQTFGTWWPRDISQYLLGDSDALDGGEAGKTVSATSLAQRST